MNIDAELCRMFDGQAAMYSRALSLAQSLATHLDEESRQAELEKLALLIDGVREEESRHKTTLQSWRDQRKTPSPELRSRMERVSHLIQTLQTILDTALQEAHGRKAALAPQFDALSRLEQGRKAYGAAYSHVPRV